MLGKKDKLRLKALEEDYLDLLHQYDIIVERLDKILEEKSEPKEVVSPYYDPDTGLYDFKFGREKQMGGRTR